MPAKWKSREDVQEATLCLRSVENLYGTRTRAETVAPGATNPIWEPRKGLIAL
jgi:hypothetical protein